MKLQHQPNNWSCLPTAFAMVLDLPVKEIIDLIGHDGSTITWPKLPSPFCRRAFHIQELINVSHRLGYTCTPFVSRPLIAPSPYVIPYEIELTYRPKTPGVVLGKFPKRMFHAMAFDGEEYFNPGIPCEESFQVDCFYSVIKSG